MNFANRDGIRWLAGMNALVGMAAVKNAIVQMHDSILLERHRLAIGEASDPDLLSTNFAFLGGAGVGKLTCARIIGEMLCHLEVLPKGHTVAVSSADLAGHYVGQALYNIDKSVEDALGGLLYISGAHAISQETTDALVVRLERHRGEFACILAAPADEMQVFLQANPSLDWRFDTQFIFDNLTADELAQIFRQIAENNEFFVAPDLMGVLKDRLARGDAWAVRNLFKKVRLRTIERVAGLDDEVTGDFVVTHEDIAGA